MNRQNQEFQNYQYGNTTHYYQYNGPQEMYYQGGYPVQGDFYGGPQAYPGPQFYGQYGDMNYYGAYPQQEGYVDVNAYGYEGEVYSENVNSQVSGGSTAQENDSNGMRQQTRGKHSYSQNRSRNRQRADNQVQGRSQVHGNEQSNDANTPDNQEQSKAGGDNGKKVAETVGSIRGRKQVGRFYGRDTRSRPFENRSRRQNVETQNRDKENDDGDLSVDSRKGEQDTNYQQQNTDEHGAKPKAAKSQVYGNWDDVGSYDRKAYERYGKENVYVNQRSSGRRDGEHDNQYRHSNDGNRNSYAKPRDYERRNDSQADGNSNSNAKPRDYERRNDSQADGNSNSNAKTRDYERRNDSQACSDGKNQYSQRKVYSSTSRSGGDVSKKDSKDEDESNVYDYRAGGGGGQAGGGGGQRNQHQRYQRGTTRNRGSKKVDESQRGVLIDQLTRGTYECMVCCETVRAQNALWSCSNCYHCFHLRCIKQWARSPNAIVAGSEKNGWRCPACQNLTFKFPNQYRCFCGKVRDPDFNRMETPHSCGSVCQKDRGHGGDECKHPCNILCHPGPCPECSAMVTKTCDCGKTKQSVKCGQSSSVKCTSTCDRQLNCGKHNCKALCHAGSCEKCEETVQQDCYGCHETREVPCGSSEDFAKSYCCGNVCSRVLDCGNHTCEKKCHPGPCESCPELPSNITHCPCGTTPLSELSQEPRTSCMDPIPTCDSLCNKELLCGPAGNRHKCKNVCHTGSCGPCDGDTELSCRCGLIDKEFRCSEIHKFTGENGVFLCDKRCNRKKACGRHKCGQNCCIKTEHPCNMICGRKLSCGLHKCDEPCHRNMCPPCLMSSFDELTCTCGAEVLLPPIPCGTKPPECSQPCSREHSCNHPVRHNCHSDEKCPPCTELTKKTCMGGHEIRANIPCSLQDISCGLPCRKPLPCGEHTCPRICHKGRCLEEGDICKQPCQRKRELCEHICAAPCHGEEHCPNTPCKAQVSVKCPCGHREKKVMCSVGGQQDVGDYQKITIQSLADSIQGMMGVSSVNVNKFNKTVGGRILECNEECAVLERNKRFALALEIQNPDLSAKLGNPTYSDFLKDYAKQFPQFVAGVEKSLAELVQTAKQSKQSSRSHSFPIMSSNQRRCIHELSEHYGCETQSYDYEPKKNVVATAPRERCWLPSVTLTSLVQRELHPRAPPPIPHFHKAEVLRQNNMAAKQSTSLIGSTAEVAPNAWHTVGKKSSKSTTKPSTTSRMDKFDLGSDKPDYTKLSKETKDALKTEPVVDYFDFTFT